MSRDRDSTVTSSSSADEELKLLNMLPKLKIYRRRNNPNKLTTVISFPHALLPRKAPGEDGALNLAARNLPRKAVVTLAMAINGMMILGHYPARWNKALVVPAHKAAKSRNLPGSYGPISLLPVLPKVAAKVILTRIKEHLGRTGLLKNQQFGSQETMGTLDPTVYLAADIIEGYNNKHHTALPCPRHGESLRSRVAPGDSRQDGVDGVPPYHL